MSRKSAVVMVLSVALLLPAVASPTSVNAANRKLSLNASPKSFSGKRTVKFVVKSGGKPVKAAKVSVAGKRKLTNRKGIAKLTLGPFKKATRLKATAKKAGFKADSLFLKVRAGGGDSSAQSSGGGDSSAPSVTVLTQFAPSPLNVGSVNLGGLSNLIPGANIPRKLEGWANDDQSGIEQIAGTWTPCLDPHPAGRSCVPYPQKHARHDSIVVWACINASRTCAWESVLPGAPGFYEFAIYAVDKTGKRSTTRTVRLLVVG